MLGINTDTSASDDHLSRLDTAEEKKISENIVKLSLGED